jgi:hypothetical protein
MSHQRTVGLRGNSPWRKACMRRRREPPGRRNWRNPLGEGMASDVEWRHEKRRHRMSRIGIAISGGPNPAEMIDLVVLAESLGYESAWVAEGHGGDQFAILAACATHPARH